MSIEKELSARSGSKCELCGSTNGLTVFEVAPASNRGGDDYVMTCTTCNEQLQNPDKIDANIQKKTG